MEENIRLSSSKASFFCSQNRKSHQLTVDEMKGVMQYYKTKYDAKVYFSHCTKEVSERLKLLQEPARQVIERLKSEDKEIARIIFLFDKFKAGNYRKLLQRHFDAHLHPIVYQLYYDKLLSFRYSHGEALSKHIENKLTRKEMQCIAKDFDDKMDASFIKLFDKSIEGGTLDLEKNLNNCPSSIDDPISEIDFIQKTVV